MSIYRYLDGRQSYKSLGAEEQKVAIEIKRYLRDWADRLNIPPESRISNYITHIFELSKEGQEFDPELAKLISETSPKSVYNPFLEKRLGKRAGLIEDVFVSLDAYVKRVTRKANMDPALDKLSVAADKLDLESYNYVKRLAKGVNMQPTEIENLVDNLLKSVVGYRYTVRPTAYLTNKWRKAVYRGGLGLNVGSALKNITQGTNTFAELGSKYTLRGYSDLVRRMATGNLDELYEGGILSDNIIQDRNFHAVKRVAEKLDNVLFALFDTTEKINRGSAYYGAKAKALSKGMSEEDAFKYAKDVVKRTQFTFGAIDSPVVLQSDIAKTLGQFQSFNIKQTEFLAEMVKNKEFGKMVRWVGANLLVVGSVGKILGMEPSDMIPFSEFLTCGGGR